MAAASTSQAQKALRTAIQTGVFEPVYYLCGAEDYLKDESVRQLIEAAVDPATKDFNLEQLRASDIDGETLGSLLGTPPMMAERRVVVIRDVGALRKDARSALEQYLRRPSSDVVLVLVAAAGHKEEKGLTANAAVIEFEPLSGARIPKWIAYYATHDLGCEITEDAVGLLQDAVGTELSQLRIEIDKLASFVAGGERKVIDEQAVATLVGVRRGETMGDLLDAIGRRDVSRALELLPHVLLQPKTSAVTIVMALTTQTLALAWARTARERGVPASRLNNELFTLLKEAGSPYTGRSWGDAVRSWVSALGFWNANELDDALATLLAADVALKETRLSSDEQLLESLILTLCANGASSRRAA